MVNRPRVIASRFLRFSHRCPKSWHTRLATLAAMTDEALAAAWDAVHANTPEGWQVGRPACVDRYREWRMYAFDTTETPADGKRSGEWTAVGRSEVHYLRVMARCLAEIEAGRWPK